MAFKKNGVVTTNIFSELSYNVSNVGSLTVNDNAVTGFASGKYLLTDVKIDSTKPYIYQVGFTTGTNITNDQAVMFTSSDVNVGILLSGSKLKVWGYGQVAWVEQFAITASTKYLVRVEFTGKNYTCKYKTTGDWVTATSITSTYTYGSGTQVMYGLGRVNGDRPFLGTLHLDACWIKQNGNIIFNGADCFNSIKKARISKDNDILIGQIIEI